LVSLELSVIQYMVSNPIKTVCLIPGGIISGPMWHLIWSQCISDHKVHHIGPHLAPYLTSYVIIYLVLL
jgi:hypothetical protein